MNRPAQPQSLLTQPPVQPRSGRVSIRAHLPRPAPLAIDEEELRKACPGLGDTPLTYAREGLKHLSTHMYAGVQGAIPQHHRSQLPDELQVLLSDPISHGSICPTHILAITSSLPSSSSRKYTLFPAHQLVLGAFCASLPHFPSSAAAYPLPPSSSPSVTLPVVRLALPAPAQFGLLLWYLYVQDAERLRRSLLPAGWDADVGGMMQRATVVHGLWANACALGVVDAQVFEVVQQVWRVVLEAIAKATGAPMPEES
ncbi:hypothetical protein JR316_0003908 [Psilocybe cubensis]|uniref:Uncharacterized protein n=2 Tax=Psilocybe cubensis TaxID=181762 RepID=A0ACB8H985_PSICU|nr:hypothetical protein JR316_0003908 [Psilocybe cubensis]KAH9484426.1 hypothetical protein JR316_0003908 [Psilocybe cubensis]